jgi:Tfp pilus assembly protein PilX
MPHGGKQMIHRKTSKIRYRRGVSLVSAMVAVVILLVALIGTSSFRYYAALDGRRAGTQTTAARIALTLCESWRGVKGDQTFDPTALLSSDLQITTSSNGPDNPGDFNLLGKYIVVLNYIESVNYNVTLSWKDIQPGLRALNVIVTWASRDQAVSSKNGQTVATPDKSFALTIYTQTL